MTLPTVVHCHFPGTIVQIDADQQWSTCTDPDCGVPIHSMWSDYDGDGHGHWTAWGPAPLPIGDVRPMGPAARLPRVA